MSRKMGKKIFLLMTICILLSGCKQNRTTCNDKYICVDTICCMEPVDSTCFQYVKDISYIRLEGSEKRIIPEATKVLANQSHIFIYSKDLHKIVAYSHSGNFEYEINQRGMGNKEYMEIANFCVNDNYIYTVDNVKHQIGIYNASDGQLLEKRTITFNAWDMECLSYNEFLFTFLPNNPKGSVDLEQPRGAVWKTDSTFTRILSTYIPYSDDYYEMIGKGRYFTKSGNDVVFHSFQNSGLFIFQAGAQSPLYIDAVFPNSIPIDEYVSYDDVKKYDYEYFSETPFVTDDYICFEMGRGEYTEPYIMNRRTNHVVKNPEVDSYNAVLSIYAIIGKYLVSYISDYYYYELLISSGFCRADVQTEETLRNGGACLVIYTMK